MNIDAAPVPDAAPNPNRADRLPPDDDGCPGIYAQSILPEFHLDIEPDVYASLQAEWQAGMDVDMHPEYPLAKFRWEDVEITDATIRLRGNPTYWYDDGKMQLQISFNANNKGGRFLGLRKVLFDAASANKSFLRDRLSLKFLREAGLPAPCANNARVYINGEYYGVVTSIEKLDKEFLERVFANPEGDLWRRGSWELKTNESTADDDRLEELKDDAMTPEALEQILDVPQAITLWAADAILPNSDGPWAGGLNFYLYDDPQSGKFIHIPWDYDNGLTRLDPTVDPYTWHKEERFHGRQFYCRLLEKPTDRTYYEMYIAEIDRVLREAYVVERLQERISTWATQIRPSVAEDPNLPGGCNPADPDDCTADYMFPRDFDRRVNQELEFVAERAAFLEVWLTRQPEDTVGGAACRDDF